MKNNKSLLRVLHILNGATGGAAESTLDLIQELDKLGVTSFVYCSERSVRGDVNRLSETLGDNLRTGPLYIWPLRSRKSVLMRHLAGVLQLGYTVGLLRSASGVISAARDFKVDIIHSQTAMSPDGAIAATVLGIPHVWHIRELIGAGHPHRLRGDASEKATSRFLRTGTVIANSKTTALTFFKDKVDQVHIIYNGINLSKLRDLPSTKPERKLTFGMVANLTAEWKRHSAFIKAAAIMARYRDDCQFVIVGHDPSVNGKSSYAESLHQLVNTLGLKEKVHFNGFANSSVEAMEQLDILVHPATGESLGRVYIEAIAASRPIIAVEGGAAAEMLLNGRYGKLVSHPEPTLLAEAMLDIAKSYQQVREDLCLDKTNFLNLFSPQKCAFEVLSIYRSVIDSSRPRKTILNAIAHVMR